MERSTYTLPGGYTDEAGVLHRDAELNPLSGREEEVLLDNHRSGNNGRESAGLVTRVLSHCVRRIGNVYPINENIARDLLVADRQALMLKLRELTFGDQIQATICCPFTGCGHKMDIDFSIRDISIRESEDKGPTYEMTLSNEAAFVNGDGETYRDLDFRLPTGADQEVVSPLMYHNQAEALSKLLSRCVKRIGPLHDPTEASIAKLTPRARMEIEKQMEAVAPQVDSSMNACCPECERAFELSFDVQKFFFGELQTSSDLLYREVHYLAYHYHWSEQEIMDLTRDKRRKYIEVLADEIDRLNDGIG